MRKFTVERKTKETQITLSLDFDGCGRYDVETGCGFLDHMLELFSAHSRFDLTVGCAGDTQVDDHHTVEDVGIALGQAFGAAIGDKKGITRYAHAVVPMDETLILCAVDISGRSYLNYDIRPSAPKVGAFDTELAEEFFLGFVRNADITVHLKQLAGSNSHHILEGAFKAFARALKDAVAADARLAGEIPSSKGLL